MKWLSNNKDNVEELLNKAESQKLNAALYNMPKILENPVHSSHLARTYLQP